MFQYHYNIIHDDDDALLASEIADFLEKAKPHWKGFYSDLRSVGKNILNEAHNEIKSSKINICLTSPNVERMVKDIQAYVLRQGKDKAIGIVHGGRQIADFRHEFFLPDDFRVVEVYHSKDVVAMNKLKDHLTELLEGQRTVKLSVEEGSYPDLRQQASRTQQVSQQPLTQVHQHQDRNKGMTDFEAALVSVTNGLTQDEVTSMVFLLDVTVKDLGELQTSRQVIEYMERMHKLSSTNSRLLIDILKALDRNDLARQVEQSSVKPMVGQGISPYKQITWAVVSEIEASDLDRLKTVLVQQYKIAPRAVNECNTAISMFQLLEKRDFIDPNDFSKTDSFLRKLVSHLDRSSEAFLISKLDAISRDMGDAGVSVSVDDELSEPTLKLERLVSELKNLKENCSMSDLLEQMASSKVEMVAEMSSQEMQSYCDRGAGPIGSGGFGDVYPGVKEYCDVPVVVKVSKNADDKTRRQFVREIAVAIGVRHYALLPVLAHSSSKSHYKLMYPWMKNQDLSCWLGERFGLEPLTWKIYLRILSQVADALLYLHTSVGIHRGTVKQEDGRPGNIKLEAICREKVRHGDVKPGNILLDAGFNARLGDAGLADEFELSANHVTATTGTMGTQVYHDVHTYNKQTRKHEKMLTNDVYAFGMVIAQLLTGWTFDELFYRGEDLRKNFRVEPKPEVWTPETAGITKELMNLVKSCINPKVEQRHSMKEVVQVLKRVCPQEEGATQPKPKKCVQCMVNEPARYLPCSCGCAIFCVLCLKRSHWNPLVCPTHGPTEPPIGHKKVFAVLVAPSSGDDVNTFSNDARRMYRMFNDPVVMGLRETNIFRLGTKPDQRKKQYYEANNSNLTKALKEVGDKLDNESTLIFYITCHASEEEFKLGSEKVHRSWIVGELEKLRFRTLLLICDCCYAADNPTFSNQFQKSNRQIYQWFSCCTKKKSFLYDNASLFTDSILSGLCGFKDNENLRMTGAQCGYIDVTNLEKYVSHRMEGKCKGDHKCVQKPWFNSSHGGECKLAYYNKKVASSIMFEGLDGHQEQIELERHPRHFPDMKTLTEMVWRKLSWAYSELSENFLQIVRVRHTKGEKIYQELSQISDLYKVMDEQLRCRFRDNYTFVGRPMVKQRLGYCHWEQYLTTPPLTHFVTAVQEEHPTFRLRSDLSLNDVLTSEMSGSDLARRECLNIIQNLFKPNERTVITIRLLEHYITFSM